MKKAVIIKQQSHTEVKVYLIKRQPCGHYYLNQTINGRVFYRRWSRSTAGYVRDMFDLTFKDFQALEPST